MVSLLTLDVLYFIEEAKKKSVTTVTLLSNGRSYRAPVNFLSPARRAPYGVASSGQRSLIVRPAISGFVHLA